MQTIIARATRDPFTDNRWIRRSGCRLRMPLGGDVDNQQGVVGRATRDLDRRDDAIARDTAPKMQTRAAVTL
jgi:hypothetical protein